MTANILITFFSAFCLQLHFSRLFLHLSEDTQCTTVTDETHKVQSWNLSTSNLMYNCDICGDANVGL